MWMIVIEYVYSLAKLAARIHSDRLLLGKYNIFNKYKTSE